ncbi:NACHT domain-containing protein [Kutzneria sp. NPDC052558]|uniref:NACHT domain-containing protein n=1 Tax=Kutzneria sp. NPDC052558 TaxID=3364121 RepID=UPI0037CA6A7F
MRRRLLPVSAVLVGAALALVGNLATNTVQVTAGWAPLVWIATGVLIVVAALLQLASEPAGTGTPEETTRALREAVEVQWRSEVRILRLADPQPMPVRWSLTPEVALGGSIGQVELGGEVSWEGTGEDIAALVDRFRGLEPRRLVIVGNAGAGKTTLAIQLVRRLAADRRDGEPVPVFLSVSGWDLVAHPTFEGWLLARLVETYPALRDQARRLFALGLVLPVLDGFDELSATARPRCLRLVNEALDERTPLVLTSRTREYAEAAGAGQLITGAAVLAAEPLSADAAADYLDAMLRRSLPHQGWRRLLDELRAGRAAALADVVSSPLGLWLVLTAYDAATDPSGLLDGRDAKQLRAHLFDRLIPELVRTRTPAAGDDDQQLRPRQAHEAKDVEHWLGQLAEVMRESPGERKPGRLSTGSRDFAWWRLSELVLPFPVPTPVFPLAVTLVGIGWFMLLGHAAIGLDVVNSAVLAAMVLVLLHEGKYVGPWSDHDPAPAIRGLSRRLGALPGLLVRSLPFGLFSGALIVLLDTGFELFFTDIATAILDGLRMGALVAAVMIVGRLHDRLTEWLTSGTDTVEAGTPYANWRSDRATQIVRLALGAVLAAAAGAALTAGSDGYLTAAAAGLGLIAGACYALATGTHNAWPAYLTATARLARGNRLPRKLMPFLDDAHRLGLLRAVGPIYQFRHADFQDHLTARHAPPPPAPVAPTPIPKHSHRHSHRQFSPTFEREFRVPKRLLDVAFSPDGQTVALFRDGATDIVDLTGHLVRRIRHGLAPLRVLIPSGAIAFSPDGDRCAATGYTVRPWPPGRIAGHVTIFDVATGREVRRLRHSSMWIQAMAFSPDGARIVTGSGDHNFVRIWDVHTGQQVMTIHHPGDVGAVAFSPDGRRLATGTYLGGIADHRNTEVWDASTGEALLRLRIHPTRHHNIAGVAFSPGGAYLAAVNGWATTVWDAVTGTQVLTVPTGGEHVAFSPDGLHLLISGSGPSTELRKVSDGASVLTIAHSAWVTRAVFSPDGRFLLSVGEDRKAQLWRLWT